MGEIQKFNFNGDEIRVLKNDSGEPWFVAKDVCDAIGLTNPTVSVQALDEDERTKLNLECGEVNVINESGLYTLTLRCRDAVKYGTKPHCFRKWVTREVLPAIRKTGGYMVSRPDETPEEIMARALVIAQDTLNRQTARLAEAEQKIKEQTKQIEEKTEALELAAPKAAFVDNFVVSSGTILVRDFAKHVSQALGMRGFGEKAMFKFLKGNGYMNLNRYPTQDAADMGLFRVSEGLHMLNDGSTEVHHTTRITSRGQTYFFGKIKAKLENEGKWW